MNKNEYVSPEMEVVEIKGLCSILADSEEDGGNDTYPGVPDI